MDEVAAAPTSRCAAHGLATGPRGRCVLCLRALRGGPRPVAAPRTVARTADAWDARETFSTLLTALFALGLVASTVLTVAVLTIPAVWDAMDPGWGGPEPIRQAPPRPPVTNAAVEPRAPSTNEARPTPPAPPPYTPPSPPAPSTAQLEAERLRAEELEARAAEEAARDLARKEMVAQLIRDREAARMRRAAPAPAAAESPEATAAPSSDGMYLGSTPASAQTGGSGLTFASDLGSTSR